MHMVVVRLPTVARQILTSLNTDAPGGCLEEVQEAARTLDRHGFVDRPSWGQLRLRARAPHQLIPNMASVFLFRSPLSGDRDFCHVMCCGPGSSSVSLGRRLEMRCSDAPPGLNSNCTQSCSERWCSKGFVCHSISQMRRAHVGQHWTRWGDTVLLARVQVC